MAAETPPARGFSSGSQGSSKGAPRLRGADVCAVLLVPQKLERVAGTHVLGSLLVPEKCLC